MKKAIVAAVLAALAVSRAVQAAPPPRDVTNEDVDRAMAQAKRYLWGQQSGSGHWPSHSHLVPGGGATAIALFALLEAGESRNSPGMKKGLEALAKLKTRNLYVVTTRVIALSKAAAHLKESPYHKQLQADMRYLTAAARRHGGAWGYGGPERTGDNSCSQFALLALWEADRVGIRIDPALVRAVERTWLRRQRKDGGWTYSGQPKVDTAATIAMTTAGLASLYITQDVLTRACKPYPHREAVDAAWKFLKKDLKKDYYKNGYLAFCVQRVGMASGEKFMAGMDWFAVGAAKLAQPSPYGRSYGGRWGPVVRASFELLFLARGRIPLTCNKLAHGEPADWDFHTRDVAHFTEYMRRNFERPMRWQIVKITDDMRLLLDAPILLIAGRKAANFTPAQWAKLREYTLRGGTLLFVPCHKSREFLNSARRPLEDLYAEQRKAAVGSTSRPASRPAVGGRYLLRPLPADHPIYNAHEKVRGGPRVAPMWGISDGTRLLAVVSQRDIACPWHRQETRTGKIEFQLGVNFFLYATGANSLRMRMRPVFVGRGGKARHRAKVAWLRHGGNWSTQPYALKYLSEKLTAENRVAIELAVGAPIEASGLAAHQLAWLTGSSGFSLTDKQVKAMRAYLDGGGTLFVNAVGGSSRFADAAEDMLEKLFADTPVAGAPVGPDSPLMTGKCGEFRGPPLGKLKRTTVWRKSRSAPRSPVSVYRRHGRAVVIYARYGIHDTLDGHTAHGAYSYMPTSAREVAANVVLYSLMKKPKPPATQTAPARK